MIVCDQLVFKATANILSRNQLAALIIAWWVHASNYSSVFLRKGKGKRGGEKREMKRETLIYISRDFMSIHIVAQVFFILHRKTIFEWICMDRAPIHNLQSPQTEENRESLLFIIALCYKPTVVSTRLNRGWQKHSFRLLTRLCYFLVPRCSLLIY